MVPMVGVTETPLISNLWENEKLGDNRTQKIGLVTPTPSVHDTMASSYPHPRCGVHGTMANSNPIPGVMYMVSWASYQIRKIVSCACARNARRNIFNTTDFKGNCLLAIPACITARAGIANPRCGENVPGILDTCATRNFTYLVRGPWPNIRRLQCTRNIQPAVMFTKYSSHV